MKKTVGDYVVFLGSIIRDVVAGFMLSFRSEKKIQTQEYRMAGFSEPIF